MKTVMTYKSDRLPQRKTKIPAIIEFEEPRYCYFFNPFGNP
ncbi:hypothetical protein OROMI_008564 [Orobanche minor]